MKKRKKQHEEILKFVNFKKGNEDTYEYFF